MKPYLQDGKKIEAISERARQQKRERESKGRANERDREQKRERANGCKREQKNGERAKEREQKTETKRERERERAFFDSRLSRGSNFKPKPQSRKLAEATFLKKALA